MTMMSNTFAKYLRLGFLPRTVRGDWDNESLMYSFYQDNIQYTIDDGGDYENDNDASYMVTCLKNREMIIERNHEIVTKVDAFIKKQFGNDVWALVGAGPQLHVSFGNKDGIIAALLMDFISPEHFQEFKRKITDVLFANTAPDDIPEIDELDHFILAVYKEEYDAFFTSFNVEGIELQLNGGNEDHLMWEDDEDDE